jgi:hypothetical protein
MPKKGLSRTSRSNREAGSPASQAQPQVIWAPPVGIPLAVPPGPDAVSVFERALNSLQRHDYRAALTAFEQLQDGFPAEAALRDRARSYASLCRRQLDRSQVAAPKTVEERLTAATAALNNGEDSGALDLVTEVLDEMPGHELGMYLLAVVQARRGATAAALEALRGAIAASPETRVQARHDADFHALRDNDLFRRLTTDAPPGSANRRRASSSPGR